MQDVRYCCQRNVDGVDVIMTSLIELQQPNLVHGYFLPGINVCQVSMSQLNSNIAFRRGWNELSLPQVIKIKKSSAEIGLNADMAPTNFS